MSFARLIFASAATLLVATLSAEEAGTPVITTKFHLGKKGQWEWDSFKDRPVDAERLEVAFDAKSNTAEAMLRIWQRDVKLTWLVLLNGRKLGALTTAETAMESVFAIPASTLRDGSNTLVIEAPPGLDDVEVGPIVVSPLSVAKALSVASARVTVFNLNSGDSMPCRLTLTRLDGTLQPLLAEPADQVAVRTGVAYLQKGEATLRAPPGQYLLRASCGFEWSAEARQLTLAADENAEVRIGLQRQVNTRGWVAADSHIHTLTDSGHGDATIRERMLTIAGEGIELAIATDHNHHTDYGPAAAEAGVKERFTSVIGNEVTTRHGHFNAFPIDAGAAVVNAKEDDWSKLLPAIRATPGVKVITLNHPRDLHSGFIPFGNVQFNPKTGKHRESAVFDFDAIEVITSAAMQSDIHLLYRDWFALLNRGHRVSAIASSDSHDVNRFILGQGRTYVACDDSHPASLDLDQVWRSYREGRLLVSLGLLANIKVNEKFGVGDLATGLDKELKVEITVSGPAWTQVDRIELFANGVLVQDIPVKDDHGTGEKARVTSTLPKPAHDVHLVAIATGPGVTEPFWEIPRPYQPSSKTFTPRVIGSTNPVWIDADNDGKFWPAFAIAQDLVDRLNKDPGKIRAVLKDFDEVVAAQVESLLSQDPGTP